MDEITLDFLSVAIWSLVVDFHTLIKKQLMFHLATNQGLNKMFNKMWSHHWQNSKNLPINTNFPMKELLLIAFGVRYSTLPNND
jgi:hypothetical protein